MMQMETSIVLHHHPAYGLLRRADSLRGASHTIFSFVVATALLCAGPIPKELGALTELQKLDLCCNNLSGQWSVLQLR